jgi:hypothetical protein
MTQCLRLGSIQRQHERRYTASLAHNLAKSALHFIGVVLVHKYAPLQALANSCGILVLQRKTLKITKLAHVKDSIYALWHL